MWAQQQDREQSREASASLPLIGLPAPRETPGSRGYREGRGGLLPFTHTSKRHARDGTPEQSSSWLRAGSFEPTEDDCSGVATRRLERERALRESRERKRESAERAKQESSERRRAKTKRTERDSERRKRRERSNRGRRQSRKSERKLLAIKKRQRKS